MTPEQRAYVAGLIDGEGSIMAFKQTHKLRPSYDHIAYRIDIMCSTSKEFVKQVKDIIPHKTFLTINKAGLYNPNARTTYYLKVSSLKTNIIPFIEDVENYLILKKKQIKLLKDLINGINQEGNMNKIKKLNKRGVM